MRRATRTFLTATLLLTLGSTGFASGIEPATTGEWVAGAPSDTDIPMLTTQRLAALARSDGSSLDNDRYTLGDPERVGVTVVAPARNGRGLCHITELPDKVAVYGGCMPQTPAEGADVNISDSSDQPGVIVDGLTARDVDHVVIVTRSGEQHDALLVNGRYLWRARNRAGDTPVEVHVTRSSRTAIKRLDGWTAPVEHPDQQETHGA